VPITWKLDWKVDLMKHQQVANASFMST